MTSFNIGDIVEIYGDSTYWDGARGPVVSMDRHWVFADLTTVAGVFRPCSGFSRHNYRVVSDNNEFEPDI